MTCAPKLLAQTADMDLDGVALHLRVEGIELLLELRLGQKLTGAGQKRLEERPFARRQLDGLAVAANAACGEVDLERAMRDDRVRVAGVAPGDRADPRRQFGEIEGLHEIIVGTRRSAPRSGPTPGPAPSG